MIVNGTVKPKEILRAFGVPMITVKRYVKAFRKRGTEGFYVAKPRHCSASVLKGEVSPDAIPVVNPEWRKLDSQIRSQTDLRHRLAAQLGAWTLSADSTESVLQGFQQRQVDLREEIGNLDLEI